MNNCEYEKNGHCTLNECMYGDFLFIDDSAFDTGKHCTCDYVLPSKYIDEMVKEKKTLEVENTTLTSIDGYLKSCSEQNDVYTYSFNRQQVKYINESLQHWDLVKEIRRMIDEESNR